MVIMKFREFIKEHILKKYDSGDALLEMAIPRNDYKSRAEELLLQILQNWCLVKYCRISHDDNLMHFRNHWATELRAQMRELASLEIKRHVGKSQTKEKALLEVIQARDLDTRANTVNLLISTKFEMEHIEINGNPHYTQTIDCWLQSCKELVSVIASADVERIRQYVINL